MLARRLALALVLASFAAPLTASLGTPTTDATQPSRMIGGEVFAASFDARDWATPSEANIVEDSPYHALMTRFDGVTQTTGAFGDALRPTAPSLPGGSIRLESVAGPATLSRDFTLTAWVLPDNTCFTAPLYASQTATQTWALTVYVTGCSFYEVHLLDARGGVTRDFDLHQGIGANAWSHVAVVQHGDQIDLLVNGGTATTQLDTLAAQPLDTAAFAYVASYPNSFAPLLGSLDELRLYDRALDVSEIQSIMQDPYVVDPNVVVPATVDADCTGAMTPVTLDASASTNVAGDPMTFAWSAPGVGFDDPTAATAVGHFPLGATLATVTVSDAGYANVGRVAVNVRDHAPPVIASTSIDAPGVYAQTVGAAAPAPGPILLGPTTITASVTDACSGVAGVTFRVDDGTIATVHGSGPYAFTYSPNGVGVQFRTLTVTALDKAGNEASPRAVTFTFVGVQAPTS